MKEIDLIKELAQQFHQHADEQRAIGAANYMRNRFEFIGLDATTRRAIQQPIFEQLKKSTSAENKWEFAELLWEQNEREYHYAAMDWMNSWKKSWLLPEDADHFEWFLTNHSWWDSVDNIATKVLSAHFYKYPELASVWIEEWRNSPNFWLNRTCLIFQLKYKNEVDFELLKSLIIQMQPNKEFFIQKAIGWALRQYSKYNPTAVGDFIEEIQLTGLAKREGSKYL